MIVRIENPVKLAERLVNKHQVDQLIEGGFEGFNAAEDVCSYPAHNTYSIQATSFDAETLRLLCGDQKIMVSGELCPLTGQVEIINYWCEDCNDYHNRCDLSIGDYGEEHSFSNKDHGVLDELVGINVRLAKRARLIHKKKYNFADNVRESLKREGIEIYDVKIPGGKKTTWKKGSRGTLHEYTWRV